MPGDSDHQICPCVGANETGEDTAALQHPWRTNANKEDMLSMLVWGGIGHSTAQWLPRYCVLHRASLHFLQSPTADAVLDSFSLLSDR